MDIKNKLRGHRKGDTYEFYLQRWIDCNGDYAKVMMYERIEKRHTTSGIRKRGWRTRTQLKTMGYTDEEVQEMSEYLGRKGASTWRKNPNCPNSSAMIQFHVLLDVRNVNLKLKLSL